MNLFKSLVIFGLGLILASTTSAAETREGNVADGIYSFKVKTIDGQEKSLADYKGKALLIVNVASKCGFTPQYEGLEKLYQKYHEKGFEVLGFPANNFGGQEPGTNAEIKEFCSLKFHSTFPMFEKISVKGKDIDPLFQYLTTQPNQSGDIAWNFNKFLIAPNGRLMKRYGSMTDPMSGNITKELEVVLPK